jgi:hypothetical protein
MAKVNAFITGKHGVRISADSNPSPMNCGNHASFLFAYSGCSRDGWPAAGHRPTPAERAGVKL